jgi:cell shape-determining protein MreC
MMELQREQEARLLGTFFVQAIFLSLAIMLYSAWEWSQFSEPWESALFYGLMAFSLQAALYFTYRTMFEDSSNYRKELKRMKNKQRKRMAQMSFEMRKMQTETLLTQQMQQYQQQMALANSDGYIDQNEEAMLRQQLASIQQTAGGVGNAQDLEKMARQLGIDQFKVGPIPLGPRLTLSPAHTANMPIAGNSLNLNPSPESNIDSQVQETLV